MGFGFVVARFGLFLRELAAANKLGSHRTTGLSLWLGAALLVIGMIVNVAATVQHVRLLNRLNRGESLDSYSRRRNCRRLDSRGSRTGDGCQSCPAQIVEIRSISIRGSLRNLGKEKRWTRFSTSML
jgi:hypothetical protein